MEECYILESLVIRGLSHSVNLGIFFRTKHYLKLICTDEEVALMPAKDESASRVRLVDGGCHSFISLRSGKVLKATEDWVMCTIYPMQGVVCTIYPTQGVACTIYPTQGVVCTIVKFKFYS